MSWGGGRCVSAWYLGFPNRRFDLHKPEVDSAHVTKENLPKIERYMGKISGPLLDRIDLHIEVPAVAFKNLCTAPPGNSSDAMRQDVLAARSIQGQRFDDARTRYNAQMSTREIRKYCRPDEDRLEILRSSVNELALSARAHDKVWRVACTTTDLDGSSAIQPPHMQEAINYRMLGRNLRRRIKGVRPLCFAPAVRSACPAIRGR
jgi:predicted ATPase with chaperone activity